MSDWIHQAAVDCYANPGFSERMESIIRTAHAQGCEAQRFLCDLTPGGSEFVNDSKRCFEWLKESKHSQHKMIVKFKMERDEAHREVERLTFSLQNLLDLGLDASQWKRNVESLLHPEADAGRREG